MLIPSNNCQFGSKFWISPDEADAFVVNTHPIAVQGRECNLEPLNLLTREPLQNKYQLFACHFSLHITGRRFRGSGFWVQRFRGRWFGVRGLEVQGSGGKRFQVSGFGCQPSRRQKKTAGQIEKETNSSPRSSQRTLRKKI
jgi:hypothetical protein